MIHQFIVERLFNKLFIDLKFQSDINILTGKNGSGKTTILKLMWYMLSSNLERTAPEITFRYAELVTDTFEVSIKCPRSRDKSGNVEITWKTKTSKRRRHVSAPIMAFNSPVSKVENANIELVSVSGESLFFPTFRRIEGGFSIPERRPLGSPVFEPAIALSESIRNYARNISVKSHRFVATVSTNDVEVLLTRQYASVSDRTNALHKQLSQYISKTVGKYDQLEATDPTKRLKRAQNILGQIRKKTAIFEKERKKYLHTFTLLTQLVDQVFRSKAVKVSANLVLGTNANVVPAWTLSAGEKQMLSFLCFNAFCHNAVMFIDEPEISLHVDWQRLLLPTLIAQRASNQFIIATHSPLIYSKYPEKELDLDRLGRLDQ